jgi:hypothetical protein
MTYSPRARAAIFWIAGPGLIAAPLPGHNSTWTGSAGIFGAGLLDGYHATVTPEIFRSWMRSDIRSLIAWSWS